MPYGYNGKILKVDLNAGSLITETPDELFYRTYVGGRSLGLYYLLRDTPPRLDAFDPRNLLVFAASPVTGAPFPGGARMSAVTKSPLTGGIGEAEAGGPWGPELKSAGWDAIVISGMAARPVYLWISGDRVELRPAEHLWGRDTVATRDALRTELQEPKAGVLTIGPAGENRVRFALVAAGPHDVMGRTGIGAVMGAKNLKAVAVRGTRPPSIADPERLGQVSRWFAAHYKDDPTDSFLWRFGTMGGPTLYGAMGGLPTHNFKYGVMDGMERISAEYLQSSGYYVGRTACPWCPVACRKETVVRDGPFKTVGRVHGPEYETLGSIGSNCGVNDPEAVLRASDLCDRLGMDSISAGVTVAWAMECAERGALPRVVEGLELGFGDGRTLCGLIERIGTREGIGDVLAEGVRRASMRVGKGSEQWAVESKGLEVAAQDPRGFKIGAALGYAVGPTGGDHIQMEHDYQFDNAASKFFKDMQSLGVLRPIDAMDLGNEKTYLFSLNQKIWSLYNCLDICIFVAAPGHTFTLRHVRDIVEAVTGWETSEAELLRIGERALTLARVYNLREGLTSADDRLPPRLLEPIRRGRADGNRVDASSLRDAVRTYYLLMGWDEKGVPYGATLESLGLGWALEAVGAPGLPETGFPGKEVAPGHRTGGAKPKAE